MNRSSSLVPFLVVLILLIAPSLQMMTSTTLPQAQVPGVESLEIAPSSQSDCIPGSGWVWTNGPADLEIAEQVQDTLVQMGIQAIVTAEGYGEKDSCGNFHPYATDFFIKINDNWLTSATDQKALTQKIYQVLMEQAQPRLGSVNITFMPQGTSVTISSPASLSGSTPLKSGDAEASAQQELQDTQLSPRAFLPLVTRLYAQGGLTRNVYVIVYDPILNNGDYLSEYLHWNRHEVLTQGTIDFFRRVSNGRLNYNVVYTTVITDGWPPKIDGFRYTEEEYLAVINHQRSPHNPDTVDYNAIVNSSIFDICGKANRGEIDEVWIYNGPYFGFYESTLVGPGAYWYNSPPVSGPHTCQRLIPIMGPSPERGLDCAVHNFGHRMEATMTQVYGSWQQNRTDHNWERFALVKALSPGYSYSGCGNIHYPPNGQADYDYSNSSPVPSNCDDFFNYPNLGDPATIAKPTTCSSWNCTELDYLAYWFGHLPSNVGCGPDEKANNWWKYFADPALALHPSEACQ